MLGSTPIRLRPTRSDRPVSWLELFFDLIFVAAVAQVGEPLAHAYTLEGLARYAFLFFLIWWSWLGHTMFATRFQADDTVHRLLTMAQVFAAAVMAANAKEALSTRDAAGFSAAYAAMRIFLVVQYLRARKVEAASRLAMIHAAGYGTAAILWLGAAILDAPERFYVWGVALVIDLVTPMLCVHYTHRLPPDSAHIPERHGLFTIILIGESVTAVMRGIESQEGWTVTAASAAILGLCLSFVFWWWYFNHNAEAENRKVTSTRNGVLFFAWSYAHFPMCLGIAVAGLGVKHIISMMPGEKVQAESIRIMLAAAAFAMLSVVGVVITANEDSWQHRRRMLPAAAIAMAPALAIPAATAVAPGLILAYLVALCTVGMRLTRRKAKLPQVIEELEAVEA